LKLRLSHERLLIEAGVSAELAAVG